MINQSVGFWKSLKLSIRRLLFREVLVLGDSHSKVFNRKRLRKGFRRSFFTVCAVGGATVSGFQNPRSKTQALPVFRATLKLTSAKTVIVLLGEVDAGFVIWYRAEKHNETVSEMLEQAIHNYQQFLLDISKDFNVIVISAVLPTIIDNQDWGKVANLRSGIKASLEQRTDLTLSFNQKMRSFCLQNGITYVPCDEDVLDLNRRVNARFQNPNPLDHHYNYDTYAELIWCKLRKLSNFSF